MTDTNKAEVELKPCPFCGSSDVEYQHPTGGMGETDGYVECLECNARGSSDYFSNEDKDIKAWNKRAGETK